MKLQTRALAMAAVLLAVLQATWLAAPVTGGVSTEGFWPPPIVVSITNNLEGREVLEVHCKDAHHNLGTHWVPYGQTYEFSFIGFAWTDYYCGFTFNGALHWFDIYLGKIDISKWSIREAGPCSLQPFACYPWNHDVHASRS